MLALYRRHFRARYAEVARLVRPGASVVELCCGPGDLERHLAGRGVDYVGIDVNRGFVERLRRRGVRAELRDVAGEEPLPGADVVVMQGSLYHFLPRADAMVARMLAAARERVIVAEPVRNLATSSNPLVRRLARRHADPGTGRAEERFTAETLRDLMARCGAAVETCSPLAGGREHVYVLRAGGD